MPFRLFVLASYERCLKKLERSQKKTAEIVVLSLLEYFKSATIASAGPFIFHSHHRSYRLVFKKLQGNIWEAYVEGQVRILTRLEGDIHHLVFVGNHDQVRQFLKED